MGANILGSILIEISYDRGVFEWEFEGSEIEEDRRGRVWHVEEAV